MKDELDYCFRQFRTSVKEYFENMIKNLSESESNNFCFSFNNWGKEITKNSEKIEGILSGDESIEAKELLAAVKIIFKCADYKNTAYDIRRYLLEVLSLMDEKYEAYFTKTDTEGKTS